MPNTPVPAAGEAMPAANFASMSATFLMIDASDRLAVATTIERLINMLDEMEPDPDLEENGDDEPWLAWEESGPHDSPYDRRDDRELDLDSDEGDGKADDEPMLGAPERHWSHSQASWAAGHYDDREDDGDDLEPSLGGAGHWTDAGVQYDGGRSRRL